MKKVYLLGVACVYLLAGCGGSTKKHSDHEHEEAHQHDDHEGHEHGDHEVAEHSGSAEAGHTDEIIFQKAKAEAVGLQTKVIEPGIFTNIIEASGVVQAAQGDETVVVANVSGVISFGKTSFIDGTSVRKGQALLSIVSKNLEEGDILARARATYETARKEYERMKGLVGDKIVSEKDFDQARLAYENARVAYEALSGEQSGNGVAVTSPMNGFLKNLQVREGDYVAVGQPLATISQNGRLVLRAEVGEKYYTILPTIQGANFRTPYDNAMYKLADLNGRLLTYGKASDSNSFYIPVTFEFDNKGAIIPGSYVEIWLLGRPIEGILSVPVSALIEEQGVFFVYKQLDEEGYQKVEVKLGSNNGIDAEVLSGLKSGDVIVTQGAYQIKLASASNAIPAHTHQH